MDANSTVDFDSPIQRIAVLFPQAITSLDILDHKLALTDYLDHHGMSYEPDGDKIVVKEMGGAVLTATFDEQNRLTDLEVQLRTAVPAPNGESWDEGQLRRMMDG